MDTCKTCKSTISERYFRVSNEITCAACAKVVAEEASRDPTPFLVKGILYAFLAACGGALLRAGFESVIGLAGAAGGILGMLVRWFVFLVVAGVISTAAKAGSKGRGGVLLQIPSVIFFYLAITLAFIPVVLLRNPNLPHGVATFRVITLICLKAPFSSVLRDPINLTGLIAIFVCVAMVWRGTAPAADPVDGPFEAQPPGTETNYFKTKGPLVRS